MRRVFTRDDVVVNGIRTAVYSAGSGETLVYLHGASTGLGFDFLLPLESDFRVVVPVHPGFGDSEDDPGIRTATDYALHYIELFDQLDLHRVHLVGQSMGGFIAARFAISHSDRLHKLVLSSPVGLRVPEHPTTDIFSIPPQELPAFLTVQPTLLGDGAANPPDPEVLVARYRESVSTGRLLWERNWDPLLQRWLGRVRVPTMLLWGDADRMVPVEQADVWSAAIPDAVVSVLPGRGHLLMQEDGEAIERVRGFCAAGAAVA